MNKWISVDEKLPNIGDRVLACCDDDPDYCFVATFKSKTDWQYSDCCGCNVAYINFWQPLPELPKE